MSRRPSFMKDALHFHQQMRVRKPRDLGGGTEKSVHTLCVDKTVRYREMTSEAARVRRERRRAQMNLLERGKRCTLGRHIRRGVREVERIWIARAECHDKTRTGERRRRTIEGWWRFPANSGRGRQTDERDEEPANERRRWRETSRVGPHGPMVTAASAFAYWTTGRERQHARSCLGQRGLALETDALVNQVSQSTLLFQRAASSRQICTAAHRDDRRADAGIIGSPRCSSHKCPHRVDRADARSPMANVLLLMYTCAATCGTSANAADFGRRKCIGSCR
jgi:hypothetical protein